MRVAKNHENFILMNLSSRWQDSLNIKTKYINLMSKLGIVVWNNTYSPILGHLTMVILVRVEQLVLLLELLLVFGVCIPIILN